jgi:prepilin signal peptidase PulO-like enzyme (type II secretory pathway)
LTTTLADWKSGLFPAVISAALAGVAAIGLWSADPPRIAGSAFLAATMGAIAAEDMRRMRVPDAWSFPAALGGLVAATLEARANGLPPLSALGRAGVSLIVCGGVFFLLRELYFRWRGVEGLGFGDVKLAATGGTWLGWEIFPAAVTVAAVGAILWVAGAAAVRRGWPREQKIPFGAFLAPAIWICWVYMKMSAA